MKRLVALAFTGSGSPGEGLGRNGICRDAGGQGRCYSWHGDGEGTGLRDMSLSKRTISSKSNKRCLVCHWIMATSPFC